MEIDPPAWYFGPWFAWNLGVMTPTDPRVVLIERGAWRQVEVNVTAASPGRFEHAPNCEHRLMIHLGAPARVTYRRDKVRQAYLQTRGDIDVIPAGSAAVFDDDDPTSLMTIWMRPALLASVARDMARSEGRQLVDPRIQQRDERIFRVALLLKVEAEAEGPSDPLFVDSMAVALASRLLEQYGAIDPVPSGARLSRLKLKLTLDYIEARLDAEIRLAELAELTNLSQSHFRVLFRQTLRRPLHRYVIERRVHRAKALIEGGAVSLSQAALDSGFCHQSHLARCMRQVLGLTPSQVMRGEAPSALRASPAPRS